MLPKTTDVVLGTASSYDARAEMVRLRRQALAHRAINHPYLAALASGELPAPATALRDLTYQYQGYSSWFQRYLTGVIHQLEEAAHRAPLIRNLAEECGALDEQDRAAVVSAGIALEWVDGIAHSELYERFLRALGVHASPRDELIEEVLVWRTQLLQACSHAGALVAIGALGLGTELVVAEIYRPILAGIERFLDVSPRDRVFFDLHCTVDDGHGRLLEQVALELIHSPTDLQHVKIGMYTALGLRASFFDAMWRRALDMKRAEVMS